MSNARPAGWPRALDGIIVVLALALVALVLSAIVGGWRGGEGGIPGETGDFTLTGAGPAASLIQVTVRPDENRLMGIIEVDVPEEWLQSLTYLEDDSEVYDCNDDGYCRVADRFDDYPVEIRLSHGGDDVFAESLEMKDLAEKANQGPLIVPIDIEVTGVPLRFPDDKYRSQTMLVSTFLPTGVGVNGDYIPSDLPTALAAASTLDSASGLGDYSADLEGGHVTVTREQRARHLVYAIAAAPVLLIVVAVRTLFTARRTTAFHTTGFLELAAALLAILPLRTVLVPDRIGGLTRLDYILATEVVAIVSVVAVGAVLPGKGLALSPHNQAENSPLLPTPYHMQNDSKKEGIEGDGFSEAKKDIVRNKPRMVEVGLIGIGVGLAAFLWRRSQSRKVQEA